MVDVRLHILWDKYKVHVDNILYFGGKNDIITTWLLKWYHQWQHQYILHDNQLGNGDWSDNDLSKYKFSRRFDSGNEFVVMSTDCWLLGWVVETR